jgi:hypothetical protein
MLTATVERRVYTRLKSEVPVNIYYGDSLLVHCNTVNFSVGGIVIKTKDIGLLENSLIEIMFDIYSAHSLFEVRIPAIVLRCEKEQIAASFENLEKGTEELISACHLERYPECY